MAFTREAVEALSALHDEPAWLRDRRLQAYEVFERTPLPDTRRDKDWRQVDLKPLRLDAFQPFAPPNGKAGPALTSDSALAGKGVIFCPLWQAAAEHPELLQRYLFNGVRPERDKFTALHAAFFSGGTFLYVPEGVQLTEPLISRYPSSGVGVATMPHTVIVAAAGSRFQYLDEFAGEGGQAGADGAQPNLASGSTEIFVEDGASIDYVGLQRWEMSAWQFASQQARLGRDAQLRLYDVALGGRFARLRLEVMLEGPGASAELKGLFFGSGEQAFDFRTLQDHLAPHTTSDLLFKGALRDVARSVYVGVVRVEKQAPGTSANQANRNLLLSEHSRATSEPILEIENNDILRCSHGATVGPVDPEHLFYLLSRGISRRVAERMLVEGFLAEVFDRVPLAYARDAVEQELAHRIG